MGLSVRKWWIFWPIYAGLMGFALGASFFFGMYGRNVPESSVTAQHEKKSADETTKSKKDETDEALAFYTLWLMAFTGILAFATIGLGAATVLLYATGEKQFKFAIRSSIRQSRDTQESIRAAQALARSAADSAYSERAWISQERAEPGTAKNLFMNGVIHKENLLVSLVWRNTGRSPATNVNIFTTSKVLAAEDPVPVFEESGPFLEERKGILGPTIAAAGEMQVIVDNDVINVKTGKSNWYVYSKVTYGTVFEPHITRTAESCFRVVVSGDRILPNGDAVLKVDFMAVGRQNTAT